MARLLKVCVILRDIVNGIHLIRVFMEFLCKCTTETTQGNEYILLNSSSTFLTKQQQIAAKTNAASGCPLTSLGSVETAIMRK